MQHYVAIVTGGAQGIGRGIVRRLLEEVTPEGKTAWAVVSVDRDERGIADASTVFAAAVKEGRLKFHQGNVGSPEVASCVVRDAVNAFKRLDLVVNNAGGGGFVPLLEQTPEGWLECINSNLSSAFFFSQAAAPELTKVRGAIVNISSTRAYQSEPGSEAYSASKGGLVALTHSLAASLAHKVTVNCVCPGWVDVSGPENGPDRIQATLTPQDSAQHWSGRVGRPEDVADAVLFLQKSKFVTGQAITVDGGMTKKMVWC